MPYTATDIERALALPDFDAFAAQGHMIPVPRASRRPSERDGAPRIAAVLLLLYPYNDDLHLLLTRRPATLNSHAGQISLPGGAREDGEGLAETAVREAQEEVGVEPDNLRLLGRMSPMYIPPTDFEVHPFVAWHATRPTFRANPVEVAELIEVPVAFLAAPDNRLVEEWEIRGRKITVPFFQVNDHKVWGATAMILSEFIERLNRLDGPS